MESADQTGWSLSGFQEVALPGFTTGTLLGEWNDESVVHADQTGNRGAGHMTLPRAPGRRKFVALFRRAGGGRQ
jgi:hypothetical protein